jgi:ubiquinone/menaquinone biosynthesis C-methylase UbiE
MGLTLQRRRLYLPPRAALPERGPDDPVEYYYRPLTAWPYRARLRLAMRLLGSGPYASLLEVGYASGILLAELARRTESLAAIDVHPHRQRVDAAMERLGVNAVLRQGSLLDIPFPADQFDGLVCLSVLEHITELDAAFEEFARVLRPSGTAVIGFPARNAVTDRLFRMLGYDPREIHPSSHADIIDAAQRSKQFEVEGWRQIPPLAPHSLSAYIGGRLRTL